MPDLDVSVRQVERGSPDGVQGEGGPDWWRCLLRRWRHGMWAGNRLLQRDGKLRGLTVLPGLAKLSGAGEGFSVLTAVGCLLRHGAMIGIHGHAPHGVCHRAGG